MSDFQIDFPAAHICRDRIEVDDSQFTASSYVNSTSDDGTYVVRRMTLCLFFQPSNYSSNRPRSAVVKHHCRCGRSGVRLPGQSNLTQCRQQLATAAIFLRSCVVQALNRGDGSRPSLHASVQYREYNEDLIFLMLFLGRNAVGARW